jgi:ethanolamine kinase
MGNCLGAQGHIDKPDGGRDRAQELASTPKKITTLEISDLLNSEIAAVLSDLLPTWNAPEARDIDVAIISGGISNALFRVGLRRTLASPFDSASKTCAVFSPVVVVRVYGENTEKFVDREKEVETMRMLYQHGFGPEVLGEFGNGRVESFLSGQVCLEPGDLGREDVAVTIAETLARFHLISSAKGGRGGRALKGFPVPRPQVGQINTPFGKTRAWLETAKTLEATYDVKQIEIYRELNVDAILEEVRKLEAKARGLNSPLTFTHNDLLSGNIMVARTSEETIESMTFIDFEYADWAPRGFDLGNHFCEYAGFDCDYSKYPDESDAFVRAYLRVFDGVEPSADKVKQVVREANVFGLAAHLYWGAWSLLQAKWSSIDFDYMSYAKLRVDEYYKRRADFMQNIP